MSDSKIVIMMEYLKGDSLYAFVKDNEGKLSEDQSVIIFKQVADAIKHCH